MQVDRFKTRTPYCVKFWIINVVGRHIDKCIAYTEALPKLFSVIDRQEFSNYRTTGAKLINYFPFSFWIT